MVYYFYCSFFVRRKRDMNTKTWVITVGGVVCAPLLLGDADSKSTENAIETDEKSKDQ